MNLPWAVGTPVMLAVTLDPAVADLNDLTERGNFVMSGGATKFQATVGDFIGNPLTSYSLNTITVYDGLSPDGYGFLSDKSENMHTDFPGILFNAEIGLVFERRLLPGPILLDTMPTKQPNPGDFDRAYFAIRSGSLQVIANLYPIPEPTSLSMMTVMLGGLSTVRYRTRASFFIERLFD